jgi:hypothetical protein
MHQSIMLASERKRRVIAAELRPQRTWGLWLAALGALMGSSCTLTKGEFEPTVVAEAPPAVAPAATAPAAPVESASPAATAEPVPTDMSSEAELGSPPLAPACVSGSCESAPSVTPASCSDGQRNGTESDVDCGEACSEKCALGQACTTDFDCASSTLCSPNARVCVNASCQDGRLNQDEILIDCGGGDCPGCPLGTPCSTDADCESQVCGVDAVCSVPSCDDGVANQAESDVDCGGACPDRCDEGRACEEGADCASGVCAARACAAGVLQCCQAPSCTDRVANGGEADVDCGDLAGCPRCADGEACTNAAECVSASCPLGTCQSVNTCGDGAQGAAESDVDCGGPDCVACASGRRCFTAADCRSSNCLNGVCISCGDGVINGTETDFDCGGADPFCQRCADGRRCSQSSDCFNSNCLNGICISCGDSVINGSETDFDCGGADPFCQRCADGRRCSQSSDCFNSNCLNGVCISCGDSVINGSETDFDCGGSDPFCQRCAAGRSCVVGSDCASGVCQAARCT